MRLIQMWLALVVLVGAGVMAFGPRMTVGTGALLLTLGVVPAALVLLLWPAVQPPTAAEVLYDRDRSA